jgi:hypothetical protein
MSAWRNFRAALLRARRRRRLNDELSRLRPEQLTDVGIDPSFQPRPYGVPDPLVLQCVDWEPHR